MNCLNVYFIGIGGIGMSALARWFVHEGMRVAGYDRTSTPLTRTLEAEGISIHYDDDPALIPTPFRDPQSTLVIYTPAVPEDHRELSMFRREGFTVVKRAEALGRLCRDKHVMAVAGTHGKTTTTTLAAWLNASLGEKGCAFLGGISRNFGSNLVLGSGERAVVEADEFDRSFLQLSPDAAVVTSADADHLDIYGSRDSLLEAFQQFVNRIRPGGTLILKQDVPLKAPLGTGVYSYSLDGATSFRAENITPAGGGRYRFDLVTPDGTVSDCTLGIPGLVNVENAVAACALAWAAARAENKPLDADRLRAGLESFEGVKRRFEIWLDTPRTVYMDDYAHHPRELRAALESLRDMYPGRRITAVFQPHLYTRTRDFYPEFADALSLADEVILLPVYPAREEPIEGVDSGLVADLLTVPHRTIPRERLTAEVERASVDVLVTFGAGDIDNYPAEIARRLKEKLFPDE